MQRRVPDCSRLHALIGFSPKHSLDDIINAVIADQLDADQLDQAGFSSHQPVAG